MSIRALDYCPPTALRFQQFLSALLHADKELYPLEAGIFAEQTIVDFGRRHGELMRQAARTDQGTPTIDAETTRNLVQIDDAPGIRSGLHFVQCGPACR